LVVHKWEAVDVELVEEVGFGGVVDGAGGSGAFAGAEKGDPDDDAGGSVSFFEPGGEGVEHEVGVEGEPASSGSHRRSR
jgi:hypothetical protein